MERRLLPASAVFLVSTTADAGPGSLRWAIGEVNASAAADPGTIRFALPADGPATIRVLSPLATIEKPVFIEARSAEGSPTVRLDGSTAGAGADGLVIAGGRSVVAGLIVTGFSGAGIVLAGPGGDFVESCYVGLVPGAGGAAPKAAANGTGILIASSSGQTIGGPDGRGNVVAGNRGAGVLVVSATPGDSADVAVLDNWIGTDPSGTADLGNGGSGVVFSGATGGRIEGNVVSGNQGSGILLNARAEGNRILDNLVGLSPDGTRRLGNRRDGVTVDDAPGNAIGGPGPGQGNRIGGNGEDGVRARNDSAGLTIRGNWIGVDPTGLIRQGNLGDGVGLASHGVTIGGPGPADGNVIAFNGQGTVGSGVQLIGNVRANAILSNRIYSNAGLGINLGSGPTTHHAPPSSPPGRAIGPNDWVNYPILSTSFADGEVVSASGRIWGMPGRSYTVQFFWTSAPDPSGFGEGERYLGQSVVTTNGKGEATFALPIQADPLGGFLTATSTDELGNTSEFAPTVVLTPVTDLRVELTADPPMGPQGSPVTFTATVTNRGHLAAAGAALTVSLPAGARVESVSAGASMGSDGIRLPVGALAPGASAVLTVVARPPAGFSGTFEAVATATMALAEARPGDETARASSRQTPAVDAALALAGPTTARRGDVLRYVLTASNAGPASASGVRISLPIPAGASFVSATTPVGSARVEGGAVVVSLGDLAPGARAAVVVELRADAVGVLSSVASLTSGSYDLDPLNQSATLTTAVVGRVDLTVAMRGPAVVVAGREYAYEIKVRNAGPDDARDVTLRDLLPEGVELVSAEVGGGATVLVEGRLATLKLGAIASGGSITARLVVRPAAAAGSILRNAARVSSGEDDAEPANDAAWMDTTVREPSNLGVAATVDAAEVMPGATATFRVRVRNEGPAAEPNAVLAIAAPAGSTLVSATSGRGDATASGGLLVFRLGALAAGEEVEATLVLTSTQPGPLRIDAVVGGLNVDEDASNQRASAVATVLRTADLATYVAPPREVFERSEFQYTLVAANLSATPATGVRLTAPLPPGVEFVSAVASQGGTPRFNGREVVATPGTIAGGATASITITVRVAAAAGTTLLLSGVSASDQADPKPENDRGGYAVKVAPAVDLTLRLRPLSPSVEVGGDVLWLVEVWNSSPTPATGVSITVPIDRCGSFAGASVSQGSASVSGGMLNATVGTLAPRGYATIAFVMRPTAPGVATLTAAAVADQRVRLTTSAAASAALNVIEPPGTLGFASPGIAVDEAAGAAYLTIVRSDGARGAVSVRYRTTSGTAAAGVDYQPTSGVVAFQPGQTSAVIAIPVLPYAHNLGDVSVGVVLEGPTGGATLGATSAAVVTVRDLDPDFLPPSVGRLRLLGPSGAIGGLSITLSEPADPASALNGRAYALYDLGPGGVFGDGDDAPIPLPPPGYDAATRTIHLALPAPLATNRHYAVVVRGAGPDALVDLAGHPLGGGVDFVGLFARGTSLTYTDATGDAVSLTMRNGGFLDLLRAASGDATSLVVQEIAPGRSTLTGTVARQRGRGDGVTPLGTIEGLGSFGDVRVSLRTPPFLTTSLPSPPPRTGRLAPTPARPAPLLRRLPPLR